MTDAPAYVVRAHNTATQSENKMHDDAVAASYGFAGGLVPGVDVYAYLTHVPAARWGLRWLTSGTISARFVTPVYDGDEVTVAVTAEHGRTIDLELRDSRGGLCATATAGVDDAGAASEADAIPRAGLPTDRPPSSPASLAPGTVLGTIEAGFHADRAGEYLDDVGERLPLYRDQSVAHPGWLLRFANAILVANVKLGPWIHVGSDVRFHDVVSDGDLVEVRARVLDEHARKGHRFVVLTVGVSVGGRPVSSVTHTAIHQPRQG
jgi:acyl dehydratase